MTTAIGNLAGDRLDQGDLRGAIQLYEESRQAATQRIPDMLPS